MQATDTLAQPVSPQIASFKQQPIVRFLVQGMRGLVVGVEIGLIMVGILGLQQVFSQVYSGCWQLSLLFTLIGLMIILMVGQYYLNKTQSRFVEHWTTVSSIIVTLLGIGLIACILTTPVIA